MKIKTRINRWAVWGILLALAVPAARAQDQGIGDMMFTAGTVLTDDSGQEWAWLQWMATENTLLQDIPMDIYWKAGDTTSADPLTLKGTAMQTSDPLTIGLLLKRGEILGENLTRLEAAINSLYAEAHPDSGLSLSEKIAALIDGSQADPDIYENLVFMGRAHPAIAMAIGQGYACRIPAAGFSTFEVRDHRTGEIIGRITLEAGNPVVLPAPGPLARVPETSPMGNLNIRLRWDIPADLLRLSLLQFGYNLYRVEAAAATNWWGATATPPSTADLLNRVAADGAAKKVNRMPIVVDAALASSNTWYAVDDNDGLSGGTPFVDGKDYYYYLTALDLLGRDGDLSDPFLTFPCDRMAPVVPHGIETRTISGYTNGIREQWVEISWDHDTNDVDTARYYVYRFASFSNMQSRASDPLYGRLSGAIVPDPAATRIYYEDRSLTTNDWGTTYWYTVRAEDNARCAPNLTGNSAPAYGLVRDWEGPPPATGVVVRAQVETLLCKFESVGKMDPDPVYNITLACSRPAVDSRIAWVEFSYYPGSYQGEGSETTATTLMRIYYRPQETLVERAFQVPVSGENRYCTFFCRVGSNNGTTSNYAYHRQYVSGSDKLIFSGEDQLTTEEVPGGPGWGPAILDFPKPFYPLIEIPAVEGAESYRLYRRIDGGRRTLIYDGEMDELLGAAITDYKAGTVNGCVICYYYQLIDENGNAGPMVKIVCFRVEPLADMAVPVLNPIDPAGEATTDPGMVLNWFCAPAGIERFELAVAVDDGPLPATFGDAGYALTGDATNLIEVVVAGETNQMNFGFYRTGRVGTAFGTPDNPQFTLNAPVDLNRDYTVMVRAIGTVGTAGGWSNAEPFRWSTVSTPGPQVPWPTRALPPVQATPFHTNLTVQYLANADYLYLNGRDVVGIRIGEFPVGTEVTYNDKDRVTQYSGTGSYDPLDHLYHNALNGTDTVLPCLLYRYQVPNDLYLTVGGDVAQVSPLMENIAWGKNDSLTVIYDPFIVVTRPADTGDPWGIYLIDTQPIVRGAAYQYLLLRLDEETKEIDRIIPVGTVTIP